jgi:mannosyltransferase OCH1-like enzyme
MIPKIVHYCWFGKKPIPKMLQYCINSWKVHLSDYEIILWNEDNFNFDCDFVREAYNKEKWAFVSDYVRLKVVYDYGGIYLDTDMLLFKPLDFFLNQDCFFVAEHKNSIGVCVFGAASKNDFIKDCTLYYENYNLKNVTMVPMPKVVTDAYEEKYERRNIFLEDMKLEGLTIYQEDYFYALPYGKLFDIHNYENYLKANSYGVHLWFGSWHSYNELMLIRRKEYSKAFKNIYKTLFVEKKWSFKYLKKVVVAFKESFQVKNAFKL